MTTFKQVPRNQVKPGTRYSVCTNRPRSTDDLARLAIGYMPIGYMPNITVNGCANPVLGIVAPDSGYPSLVWASDECSGYLVWVVDEDAPAEDKADGAEKDTSSPEHPIVEISLLDGTRFTRGQGGVVRIEEAISSTGRLLAVRVSCSDGATVDVNPRAVATVGRAP